jgi:hypothetical protein
MMFHALSGLNGFEADTCYYECALLNINSLPNCAQNCCAAYPDDTDSLCQFGPTTPATPAETDKGVIADVVDTVTGNYPGGSNAAAAATCANNPTFACWWQQYGTTALLVVGGLAVVLMLKK